MPIPFDNLTVLSPAKVNLHLAVKNKRQDGFHDLESVFVTVDFGDILHFCPIKGENLTEIHMDGVDLQNNIIFKALSLFREKTGFSAGVQIKVEKRIPLGGGLGGGSSNAAATLLTLNKIADLPLSQETLLEMGASLGSDVPFFLHEVPCAWVTGRGEHIQPIEAPCQFLVLVNPGFHSDTAAAFRLLKEYRSKNLTTEDTEFHRGFCLKNLPLCDCEPKVRVSSMVSNSFLTNPVFYNDFLPVFPEKEKSVYNEIISMLQDLGADFAGLSGAGSTCFGVFELMENAQKAADDLRSKWDFVQVCKILHK